MLKVINIEQFEFARTVLLSMPEEKKRKRKRAMADTQKHQQYTLPFLRCICVVAAVALLSSHCDNLTATTVTGTLSLSLSFILSVMHHSGSKRDHTTSEEERRVQQRSSDADEAAANTHTAAAAAAPPTAVATVSPAAMLYSHALESIFAFATLSELAALICVTRTWQASVLHMRPIAAAVDRECASADVGGQYVHQLVQSRLRRHVSHLSVYVSKFRIKWMPAVTNEQLVALAHAMPHLRSLDICVLCNGAVGLDFPARLQTLSLRLAKSKQFVLTAVTASDSALLHQATNAVAAVSQLAELADLKLDFPYEISPSLEPLRAAAQLRTVDLSDFCFPFSADNMRVLREMSQLHELVLPLSPLRTHWSEVLLLGHQLQLRTISVSHPTAADAAALSTLHSLTEVRLTTSIVDEIHFIGALPQLQSLSFGAPGHLTTEAVTRRRITTLQQCTQLTSLTLNRCSTALLECLQHLQLLTALNLRSCTGSNVLSLITQSPCAAALRSLQLRSITPRAHLNTLTHLQQMRALQHFAAFNTFTGQLTDEQATLYRPPSALLPALQHFVVCELPPISRRAK